MDEVTLDRALLYAVLQGGTKGFFAARKHGLRAEHVQDAERPVYELFEEFARKGRLPTVAEIKASTGQDIVVPTDPYDVDLFSKQIVDRTLMQALRDGIGPIMRDVSADPHAARAALAELTRITSWSAGSVTSYVDPQIVQEIKDGYEQAKARIGKGLLGLSSPWQNVDKHSLGLQPGELTVLFAKRKTGKTWLMLKWLVHILKNDLQAGENVLFVSMEMPRKAVYRRMAAIDLLLPYAEFRGGMLETVDENRLDGWVTSMMAPDDTRATINVAGADVIKTGADIIDKVAELNPRLVAIDGLYILKSQDRRKGMWERTVENCELLKNDLCAEMDVPVMATTQFKGTMKKDSLTADADDAAYAKAIGDWADAMRGLFMNAEYEQQKRRVFRAMESREFQGVDLQIHFDLDKMCFDEIKVMDESEGEKGAAEGGATDEAHDPDTPAIIDGSGGPEVVL